MEPSGAVKTNIPVLGADALDLESLAGRLGGRFEIEGPFSLRVSWLDTFDWRLYEAGHQLTLERDGRRTSLLWSSRKQPHPYVLPIEREAQFAHDLPEGFLRSQIEPVVEARALLALGVARVRRRSARVTDRRGNIIARVLVEEFTALDSANRAVGSPRSTVTVQSTTPDGRNVDTLVKNLRDHGACREEVPDPFRDAVEARGRRPGDYSSKPRHALQSGQRSDDAMRTILGHLFETMQANVKGVLSDIDVEFLHDLRVATRRARSALAQIKGVLPREQVSHLAAELRWLGSSSNRCRDLDVYLLELDSYRRQLGDDAGAVDDLERVLRRERSKALRRVRSALRSKRFQQLLTSWQEVLDPSGDSDPPPKAARPVSEVAGRRILKAYRRMVKRGSRLADPPPPEELHRLRIDAKKLRYLLEFFASLYPRKTVVRLVKELKGFQDVLGGFNDMEVQRAHLTELAQQLVTEGESSARALFALGRLTDTMSARQEEFRRAFAARFADFSSQASRQLYAATFGEV